jgi:biotin carboxyl carrier protein
LTRYSVIVADKQYEIDLTKTENQEFFMVKIDEKPRKLELKNKFEYDTPVQIQLGEKTFTIQVARKEKQASFQVKVQDIPITAEVKTQQANSFSQPATIHPSTLIPVKTSMDKVAAEGTVNAPMAGRIVSIRVKKGGTVKVGMVICILEAMKMENEIVAQKDGVVKEVFVSAGSVVNKGDPMFVIEPSED